MKTLLETAADVEENVRRLIDLHEENVRLKKELESENDELKRKITDLEEGLSEVKETVRLGAISSTIKEGSGSSEVKLKINELVREVDKCISLLNK